jgi:hypothetical protein
VNDKNQLKHLLNNINEEKKKKERKRGEKISRVEIKLKCIIEVCYLSM